MKALLVIGILIFSSHSQGQKIALLSSDFKKPIIYTDSLTVEQVSNGYIPIGVNSFDSFYAELKYLQGILNERQRSKMASFELRAGRTVLSVSKVPRAYGDHFNILVTSKFGEVESNWYLTKDWNNKRNSERLNELIKYITKNRSMFQSPYEIHPTIYNVVMVKE